MFRGANEATAEAHLQVVDHTVEGLVGVLLGTDKHTSVIDQWVVQDVTELYTRKPVLLLAKVNEAHSARDVLLGVRIVEEIPSPF